MAEIGHWLRSEGYSFGWHNHEFEFQKLPDGSLPFDRLLEGAPLLDWECDVAWVSKAVKNPIPIIKKYADRITAVHIKDVAPKGENIDEEGWADVGQGILDWPKILKTLENSRAMHLVIEHDNPNDLVRFAQRSFDFVKAL
jgi:sugar phosphate isomerase/epimerase